MAPNRRPAGPEPGLALGQKYFAAGMRFAGGIVVFTLGGYAVDRWLGWTPVLTVTGTVVGAVLSFVSVYRQVVTDTELSEKPPAKDA